jgi:hypothetical protein
VGERRRRVDAPEAEQLVERGAGLGVGRAQLDADVLEDPVRLRDR